MFNIISTSSEGGMSCIFVARTEQSSDTSKNVPVPAGCVESLIKGFVEAENKKFKLLLSVCSSVLSVEYKVCQD